MAIWNVYKPVGKTPLEVVHDLKKRDSRLSAEKITYAGRLDPLAHGVLLLVSGKDIEKKEELLKLQKTYAFSTVLGIETDSYDLMGYVSGNNIKHITKNYKKDIEMFVKSKIGKHKQPYPPFSSKPVKGKPLFWWAKEEKLDQIGIPTKEIEIGSFEVLSIDTISSFELKSLISRVILMVKGDFRQDEILLKWERFFKKNEEAEFPLIHFQVSCSSGTYVRSLSHELGLALGCGAVTIDILRTKVGEYTIEESLKL